MTAVFIDCTEPIAELISAAPETGSKNIRIHVGDPNPGEIVELARGCETLLVEHTYLTAETLRACADVRRIIYMGAGASSYIDLAAAKSLNIAVETIVNYGDTAVAEYAIGLLFAAARDIALADREVRSGVWHPRMGIELKGKTIAVIGLGGIGVDVTRIALGLGMHVRAWNRSPKPGPEYCGDLLAALRGAHAVTLHLGLNKDTRGLIGKAELKLPQKGFILVNTARAALIDTDAMVDAISDGQIGHAALDVFDDEPLSPDHKLRTLKNVTLSPHASFMTREAILSLWKKATAVI